MQNQTVYPSLFLSCCLLLCSHRCAPGRNPVLVGGEPNQTWAGRRIVTLEGLGDYFVSGDHGQPQLIRPEGLGVNIVAVVQRLEGDRIGIKANGAGDVPVGWVNKKNAILLDDAIPYFTSLIEHNPKDWDAYLRRAESEHALNQREAGIADYTRARRRVFMRTVRILRTAIQEKPIALIEHAIALDTEHPTYLTVLALAYFRSGKLQKAIDTQRQALESPSIYCISGTVSERTLFRQNIRLQTDGSLTYAPFHFPSRQSVELIFCTNRFASGIELGQDSATRRSL